MFKFSQSVSKNLSKINRKLYSKFVHILFIIYLNLFNYSQNFPKNIFILFFKIFLNYPHNSPNFLEIIHKTLIWGKETWHVEIQQSAEQESKNTQKSTHKADTWLSDKCSPRCGQAIFKPSKAGSTPEHEPKLRCAEPAQVVSARQCKNI